MVLRCIPAFRGCESENVRLSEKKVGCGHTVKNADDWGSEYGELTIYIIYIKNEKNNSDRRIIR